MNEAPENIKHWSGCDPADSGYCPDCGEHLDYGRCRCEPEEHCPNMTVTEFKERIKTICGIRPGTTYQWECPDCGDITNGSEPEKQCRFCGQGNIIRDMTAEECQTDHDVPYRHEYSDLLPETIP